MKCEQLFRTAREVVDLKLALLVGVGGFRAGALPTKRNCKLSIQIKNVQRSIWNFHVKKNKNNDSILNLVVKLDDADVSGE